MKFVLPLALVLTVVLGYLAYSLRANKVTSLTDSSPPVLPESPAKPNRPRVQAALQPSTEPSSSISEPEPPRPVANRSQRHDLSQQTPVISQVELEQRAAKVEQEANHELARLVRLLDLSEDQQDKIFATLAQNSPDYHPSMGLASANKQPLAFVPVLSGAGFSDVSTSGKGTPTTTETSSNTAATIWDGTVGIGNLVREDVQTRGEITGQVNQGTIPTVGNSNSLNNGMTQPIASTPNSGTNDIANAVNQTTTSIEDLVAPYLTGPQQSALSEEESDRIEWWSELTTNLAAGLETPAIDGPTTAPETITQVYDDAL